MWRHIDVDAYLYATPTTDARHLGVHVHGVVEGTDVWRDEDGVIGRECMRWRHWEIRNGRRRREGNRTWVCGVLVMVRMRM